MPYIPDFKRFRGGCCAVLLTVLAGPHSALAQAVFAPAGAEPIFFQAVSLPAGGTPDPLFAAPVGEPVSFAAFEPVANADSIRAAIARLEDAGDAFSPQMAEQAAELGKVLQAEGRHRDALEAFDRSLQIMRRQDGLYSAAQVSMLQAEIASHLALGDMETSDALQQARFSMQQQLHADDPRGLAEAHTDWADWNLKYYLRAQQFPQFGGITTAQETELAERLARAFLQYHEALQYLAALAPESAAHYDASVQLERKIAAITLMVDRQYQRNMAFMLTKPGLQSINQSKRSHHRALISHGSSALERALEYSVATARPALIAERQLELADWYLLLDNYDEARVAYAKAAALLSEAGMPEEQIAIILESGQPVHNPEESLAELARNTDVGEFDGYIDVEFDLSRRGKASNTRVLAAASQDDNVTTDLLRRIHAGRFRPGFDAGAPVDRKDVKLRYYYYR